ncbi:MAG: hypothetical protein V7646_3031 [Pseudonocardia sp.]|jgi:hypothetical protein
MTHLTRAFRAWTMAVGPAAERRRTWLLPAARGGA